MKLSQGVRDSVTRGRTVALLAVLASLAACESDQPSVTAALRAFTTTGNPGTVTDLAVDAVTSNSVTLSFTEVDDGTGQPAQYDVRYAVAPISWGSAASVTQDTCTTPMAGTTIGAHRTCSVLGLSASTTYQFQLVAFRGTMNLNAVYGGLSNVVQGTTAAPSGGGGPPGTVADLNVTSVASNSATLAFTEVDDGTGQPAQYDVRYAVAPISWGPAASVTQGTCTTPMAGTTIGAHRACTVLGLSASTTYQFQLVAFRGTMNVNAVYGGLSNVAQGTTTAAGPSPEAQVGQWSSVLPAPIVQVHLHLLPDGTVLSWGRDGDPHVWDPATGSFTAVPAPAWLFCAGHDFLPDGRLLVAGGHIDYDHGIPNTNLFDAASGSWQVAPAMAQGRWYPTNTTLPDGEMLTIAGRDESATIVTIPEIWDGTRWRQLTTASLELPYYPRMFVAPDGRVFYAGEEPQSRHLSVTGTGSWTDGPLHAYGARRDFGSAVMYEPGKILYAGGGDPPTNTAEIIDLNQPSPAWTYTGSMAFARRHMNATLLPTGDVLVTGGTSAPGFNEPSGAVHAAELWNPATGTWTTLASNAVTRIYHSTTLLLPDGRVLHTGSGNGGGGANELNYELYSPPYLFQGARPSITGATPTVVGYGQSVFVETPDGAGIAKVSFMRLSSVTHAFDMGARLVPLSFEPVTGGLSVALPASRTAAPPGPYMLFLVNGNGVPSVARITRLQ